MKKYPNLDVDASLDAAGLREGQAAGVRRHHRRDSSRGEAARIAVPATETVHALLKLLDAGLARAQQ